MKGLFKKSVALVLAAMVILSSCNSKADDGTESNSGKSTESKGTQSSPSDDGQQVVSISLSENLSAEIKEKYKEQEKYEYQKPMYNLPPDNKFIIDLGFDPDSNDKYYDEGDSGNTYKPIVDVFIDSEFKISVSPVYKNSSKNNKIQLQPDRPARDPYDEYEFFSSNSNWGYANQYYLVQYLDYETGEELQKPKVTVFTIDRPMNPPQLKFEKAADGYASYSWSAVEGAESYLLTYLKDDHTSVFDGMELGKMESTSYTHETKTNLNDNPDHIFTNFYYIDTFEFSGVVVYAIDSEGNYSLASNELGIDSFRYLLPAYINLEKTSTVYENFNSVPSHIFVTMCDDSNVEYPIGLDIENATIENFKEKYELEKDTMLLRIPYTPEGTNIETYIAIKSFNEDTLKEDLVKLKERTLADKSVAGAPPPPEITIGAAPKADPSTSSDDSREKSSTVDSKDESSDDSSEKSSTVDSKDESSDDSSEKSSTVDSKDESSDDNSEKSSTVDSKDESSNDDSEKSSTVDSKDESSNDDSSSSRTSSSGANEKYTVEIDGVKVYGSNALTAYIAFYMLQGEQNIDLSDFPETSNTDVILDALYEAYYQNPLALGLSRLGFNPDTSTLYLEYKQDTEELLRKQAEINDKVRDIVGEIIEDDMTDLEKEFAINQYLCDNVEYDFAALDDAIENNMISDISFRDSFTPYGALINNVGVCASYASAFKLLADEAGLDTIVAVGYLNGDLPHAWNRVYIDGQWLSVDSTNNDKEFTPNFLLNLPDDMASSMLVEDGKGIVDSRLDEFTSDTFDYEYYRYSGLYFDYDEIGAKLANTLAKDGFAVYRTDENISEDEFSVVLKDMVKILVAEGWSEEEIVSIGFINTLGIIAVQKGE